MRPAPLALRLALLCASPLCARGGDVLQLAAEGRSEYQIVLPDTSPSAAISNALQVTARLVQTAFKVNGCDVPVVQESLCDPNRPGLYLGATAFARAQGIDPTALRGWGYALQVAGRNVVVCGRDEPGLPVRRGQTWDRLGTVKGCADFLREHAGVRFLYPQAGSYETVGLFADLDLLESPALEFLPTPVIAVPADLSVRKSPQLEFNNTHPTGSGFYNIANNRFPLVDTVFGCHTYGRAVPRETYYETHPEYFALVNGKRIPEQYCISNPGFQELLHQDMTGWLDKGFDTVDLGQPDGFQACQCQECSKLFGTGDDWSEKLWLLHRQLAERVLKSHPAKRVTLLAYSTTETPPKTFRAFPANVNLMLCGTNDDDLEPWRAYEVPGGFIAYVYNWCPNLGTRYTPMRTPRYVETQARRLAGFGVRAMNRDSGGQLYGLEGPVYYVMGRMYDDPGSLRASALVQEFCGAAFGQAAEPMQRFYDQLYHGIELYSEFLGTRNPAWAYRTIHGGRRKYLSDPFQLIGFLYPPSLLSALERDLVRAENTAPNERVRTRLRLVRREFDYLKHLARVVHLHHAYQMQPTIAARDRLLDAIDARNAEIARYYEPKTRAAPGMAWVSSLFPYPGHDSNHLRLAYNGYQEPMKNTCFNWDTAALRNTPLPGTKATTARPVVESPGPEASQWERAATAEWEGPAEPTEPAGTTRARALYDRENLYLRLDCPLTELPADIPSAGRDGALDGQESVEVMLAPLGNRDRFYRFRVGPHPESKHDAAAGFISDVMDPRHGQADPTWNGDWGYETHVDARRGVWTAVLRIPFKTLDVPAPEAGSVWHINFGRVHPTPDAGPERWVWSRPSGAGMELDRDALGELHFESGIVHAQICVARNGQTPVAPYLTWTTAASNIQDAVHAALNSPLILVEAGTYALESPIVITNGITLKAVRGPAQTILRGPYPAPTGRCLSLDHPGAVAEGFTITNGFAPGNGGGVSISGGTLRHCHVVGNTATNGSGGGVFAAGANSVITDCEIAGNVALCAQGPDAGGGGVKLTAGAQVRNSRILFNNSPLYWSAGGGVNAAGGALVANCVIVSNRVGATYDGGGSATHAWAGGGVWASGANAVTLRNCLIAGNGAGNQRCGTGVGTFNGGAVIENCTIVDNAGLGIGARDGNPGTYRAVNTIVCFNHGGDLNPGKGSTLTADHCCASDLAAVTAGTNNLATTPAFVDRARGDYRLQSSSSGVDAGRVLPWMRDLRDLAGQPRISINGLPDIGAYETAR